MKYKLKIDTQKDTFQDIADRLTEYLRTQKFQTGTSNEVKYEVEYLLKLNQEPEENGIRFMDLRGGFRIEYKGLDVDFTYKTKKTGKTQKVSKLKKIELYEFDKVVFDSFELNVRIPNFDKAEGDHKVVKNTWTHGARSGIFKGKSFAQLTFREAFDKGVVNINDKQNLREILIGSMAQPYYKTMMWVAMKSPEEGQKKFDQITVDVEINNKELLEECLKEFEF